MLNVKNPKVKELLFSGGFGLEKESMRIDENGFMAKTLHPFPGDENMIRDFCENQVEIVTPVCASPAAAVESLASFNRLLQQTLAAQNPREYQWPFSNPPQIRGEQDVPVRLDPDDPEKTAYVKYIKGRYGLYKLLFSGIHFNFSFGEDLLRADFESSGGGVFTAYKNELYLTLAKRLAAYGWVLTAVSAASPLIDSSLWEKGKIGETTFHGMASLRCSECGFWNAFTPVFDYGSLASYTAVIERYVHEGWIIAASELYYPIRLKPRGKNTLENLRDNGVSHIELRMFDLNPLAPAGIDERDVQFAHLLILWLSSTPDQPFSPKDQVNAAQNFKQAAHYDLDTVHLVLPSGEFTSMTAAGLKMIAMMKEFFADAPADVLAVLDFEENKFRQPESRYAWQIRRDFSDGFMEKGIELAKKQQEAACLNV